MGEGAGAGVGANSPAATIAWSKYTTYNVGSGENATEIKPASWGSVIMTAHVLRADKSTKRRMPL